MLITLGIRNHELDVLCIPVVVWVYKFLHSNLSLGDAYEYLGDVYAYRGES